MTERPFQFLSLFLFTLVFFLLFNFREVLRIESAFNLGSELPFVNFVANLLSEFVIL